MRFQCQRKMSSSKGRIEAALIDLSTWLPGVSGVEGCVRVGDEERWLMTLRLPGGRLVQTRIDMSKGANGTFVFEQTEGDLSSLTVEVGCDGGAGDGEAVVLLTAHAQITVLMPGSLVSELEQVIVPSVLVALEESVNSNATSS